MPKGKVRNLAPVAPDARLSSENRQLMADVRKLLAPGNESISDWLKYLIQQLSALAKSRAEVTTVEQRLNDARRWLRGDFGRAAMMKTSTRELRRLRQATIELLDEAEQAAAARLSKRAQREKERLSNQAAIKAG